MVLRAAEGVVSLADSPVNVIEYEQPCERNLLGLDLDRRQTDMIGRWLEKLRKQLGAERAKVL
jgi:hypothetical protein